MESVDVLSTLNNCRLSFHGRENESMSDHQIRKPFRRWLRLFWFTMAFECSFVAIGKETDSTTTVGRHFVTNVAKFEGLSGADYMGGCDFRLTGVITLVDKTRNFMVLQDVTRAVALYHPLPLQPLEVGRLVTLEGTSCLPLFPSFPDYPHRPAGQEIHRSFEAPEHWGQYNLTRMRGYLHPTATGDHQFWIASDDSSELWLSTDSNPANARKIAGIPRFNWTDSHQWAKFPSQHSELIPLKAGETYYIEAIQEQTTAGVHLSVAWQQPPPVKPEIAVINARHLTPWNDSRGPDNAASRGVLREYWTNYFNGKVDGMAGARPYQSALSVKAMVAVDSRPGNLPKAEQIVWNRPLAAEDNYRWSSVRGQARFKAVEKGVAILEIFNGESLISVRVPDWNEAQSRQLRSLTNPVVQVEGVCEGVKKPDGEIMPERIWATASNSIKLLEGGSTSEFIAAESRPEPAAAGRAQTMMGFFSTRGIVTFNDRVFDQNLIFIQEDNSAWRIALENDALNSQLQIGRYVDLGGSLATGDAIPTITPLFVEDLGWHSMPPPLNNPDLFSGTANLEGIWTELEGIVRTVNTNGTLGIAGQFGTVCLWIGQTDPNALTKLVDAKLRARGIPILSPQKPPLLLVPSRHFIDVIEESPNDPFTTSIIPIAHLAPRMSEPWRSHRVRMVGEITYQDAQSYFLQDSSGGIRVQGSAAPDMHVGAWVEAAAFPALLDFVCTLTEPLVRVIPSGESVRPQSLNLNEALPTKQSGAFVQTTATLLSQKFDDTTHVLELQEEQRTFIATLATVHGDLPPMLRGSRLQIKGVCDDVTSSGPHIGIKTPRAQMLGTLRILLRSPGDVQVLNGPPWWTWQRTAALVSALLAVLAIALLWVHLLQGRLKRQKAAQLAFSRLVLARLEDERQRIAVNLHDSLGQTLLVVKNHAALASQGPSEQPEMQQRLNEISDATSQAIDEVRRITRDLRPYQLDRLGLTQAIRTTVNQASENGSIVFASRVEDIDGLFNKDAEIHVYRVVQEAITNAVKHSAATEAAVVVRKRDTFVSLSVRDNGRGFDMAKSNDQLHDLGYGLTGIAERVRILSGALTIDSRPGGGTNLTAEIPFHNSPT
jgi:signal transduction histidine kinase